MENTIAFEVRENSIQEFAEKYVVEVNRPQDIGRNSKEPIDPYYILGKPEIFVRKSIRSILLFDKPINFTLADIGRFSQTRLINSYKYEIEEYDDILLKLVLIDFKVELSK